jgi:hypothetical protein
MTFCNSSTQDTHTLHKPTRRRFPRRRVVVYGIDHQWQVDLVDLAKLSSSSKGFKYLLTCIDVLSFQCSVKTFNDTGFGLLVVSGKEVYVVFFEKLLIY